MSPPAQPHLATDDGIVAHLFFATVEIQVITVQIGRSTISGTLLVPDADTRTFGFCPDPDQDIEDRLLRPGKVVRVRYASLLDEYAFQGAFHSVEDEVWRIGLPRTIDRKDRRLTHRYPVLKSKRFMVQLKEAGPGARRLLVVDISPAGFAALVDARLSTFEPGDSCRAVLFLPNQPDLHARCTVVNFRHLEDDRSIGVVGCSFVGLGYSSFHMLAELLTEWR